MHSPQEDIQQARPCRPLVVFPEKPAIIHYA
jgi:hypothetical protein